MTDILQCPGSSGFERLPRNSSTSDSVVAQKKMAAKTATFQ